MSLLWALLLVPALLGALLLSRALSQRGARRRVQALPGALGLALAPPLPGRNQRGPGLRGPLPEAGAREVEVYYGEGGAGLFRRWTLVAARTTAPPAADVRVLPRRQARRVLREGEVLLGDPVFDEALRVQAADPRWAAAVLVPGLREGLLRTPEDLWHLHVHRGEATLVVGGWVEEPDRLRALLALAAHAAAAAEGAEARVGGS